MFGSLFGMFWSRLVVVCLLCYCEDVEGGKRLIQSQRETRFHKFTGVECESTDETLVKFEVCRLNNGTGLDISLNFFKPINEIMVR